MAKAVSALLDLPVKAVKVRVVRVKAAWAVLVAAKAECPEWAVLVAAKAECPAWAAWAVVSRVT